MSRTRGISDIISNNNDNNNNNSNNNTYIYGNKTKTVYK